MGILFVGYIVQIECNCAYPRFNEPLHDEAQVHRCIHEGLAGVGLYLDRLVTSYL